MSILHGNLEPIKRASFKAATRPGPRVGRAQLAILHTHAPATALHHCNKCRPDMMPKSTSAQVRGSSPACSFGWLWRARAKLLTANKL